MAKTGRQIVQSISRALALLDVLAESPTECSLGDIAQEAMLPPSTVHRLLTSLVQSGYVTRNPDTAQYGLGEKLIFVGQKAEQQRDLLRIARPRLEELALATGETVNLTTILENSVVQIDHVDSLNKLRVAWNSGERFPIHATASGKVFLAFLPEQERIRILKNTDRRAFTKSTVTDRKEFDHELQTVKQQGYALDNQEREEGVLCVAVPILDRKGTVIAAISISGPSLRLSVPRLHELAPQLKDTAQAIATSLGSGQKSFR